MPVVDCEDYCLDAIGMGAAQMLDEQIRESGKDPDVQPISYVNIYLGVRHLRTANEHPWFVCVPRAYGFLSIILHQVRHADVVVTTIPEIAETRGLCITLLWTTQGDLVEELEDAIRQADELVKQVEMRFGVPIPLPLKRHQLPDRFSVRTINPSAAEETRVELSVVIPTDSHGIEIDFETAMMVGQMVEALGPMDELLDTPIRRALFLSSKWQRQAIRARGMEEWSDVIVASNTWIETFLVQLAVLMNEADGTPILDIPAAVMARGLPRFVNGYLGQKFLKGRWDHTLPETEFGRWYESCFSLRNSVVHAGHFATKAEAEEAYEAAHKLAHFVTARAATVQGEQFKAILEPLKEMARVRS